MVRAVNKFKADFGGQFISLERVQPSSDHVPHRYLLAEAGDTLFASFVGTRQYKDIMADANILQGHIFHDDVAEDECIEASEPIQSEPLKNNGEGLRNPKQLRQKPKPAAHRVCLWHVEVDFFSFVFSVHCDFLQECVLIL
jgi:hypothetical protein